MKTSTRASSPVGLAFVSVLHNFELCKSQNCINEHISLLIFVNLYRKIIYIKSIKHSFCFADGLWTGIVLLIGVLFSSKNSFNHKSSGIYFKS